MAEITRIALCKIPTLPTTTQPTAQRQQGKLKDTSNNNDDDNNNNNNNNSHNNNNNSNNNRLRSSGVLNHIGKCASGSQYTQNVHVGRLAPRAGIDR